jgi:hypothetical protein
LCVTPEPLQIRADFRGVLITQLAVFLDSFIDDFFELWREIGI